MTVVVEFKTEYPVGKAPYDVVCVAPAGEGFTRCQTWLRISEIKPKGTDEISPELSESLTYQAQKGRWSVIGPKYEAWKQSNEIPETGMALAAWAGVSKEIADILRRQGIMTVEDVSQMTPDAAAKLPMPNARKLPKMAADYLSSRKDEAVIEENEALRERIAAMEEMLADLAGGKRGPGRPKKVDA